MEGVVVWVIVAPLVEGDLIKLCTQRDVLGYQGLTDSMKLDGIL